MPDNEPTPTADELMGQLRELDNGADESTVFKTEPEPAAKSTDEKTADSKPAAAKEAPKPDAKTDQPAAAKQDPAANANPQDKTKSKWAQNEERKAKTWQEINAQREKLEAEKAAIAKEKAAIESARQQPADQPYRDEHGYTAADYRAAEKQLREKGDKEQADAAAQIADNLAKREQQAKEASAQQKLQAEWQSNYKALVEKHPELNDPNSELHKEALAVAGRYPFLGQRPDGISIAVHYAQLEIKSRDVENTRTENARLKAELEKLNSKLSLKGGPPTNPVAPEGKKFSELSHKESEDYLQKLVEDADRERGLA